RRHLHAAGFARGPARHVSAGRVRRRRTSGGPAADRPLVRRGPPSQRRASLPAGDRLALAEARMIAKPFSVAVTAVLLAVLGACGVLPSGAPVPSAQAPSRPAPIADQPINLTGVCVQTEEDGFGENARLVVRNSQVQALSWQMQIGKRGSCS